MNRLNVLGAFCLLTFVLLCLSFTTAQTDPKPIRYIDFTFPDEIQSGARSHFNFTSNLDFNATETATTVLNVAWNNTDAEASRNTNCLLGRVTSPYETWTQLGLNFGDKHCYLANQTLHYTTDQLRSFGMNSQADRAKHFVGTLSGMSNNCNANRNVLFTINITPPTGTVIPAGTVITCDYTVTTALALPQRSLITSHPTNPTATGYFASNTTSYVSIVPTKAYVMSIKPHQDDPWAFYATLNSSRHGLVTLETVSTPFPGSNRVQFAFDGDRYSAGDDGSFWCFGIGSQKNVKVARLVPATFGVPYNTYYNGYQMNVYFNQPNSPAVCLLRIQPWTLGFQVAKPEVYLRLHQQPLVQIFNITSSLLPYKSYSTLHRVTDQNNEGGYAIDRRPTGLLPQVVVHIPIPPNTPAETIFFLRLTALEGTLIPPELLTSTLTMVTDADNGTYNTALSVDAVDPSRIKIVWNGALSTSHNYVGIVLRLSELPVAETRYRYQAYFTDAAGTLLNALPEESLVLDFLSPLTIHHAWGERTTPTQQSFGTIFSPHWGSLPSGTLYRIAPQRVSYFNGTTTCNVQNLNSSSTLSVDKPVLLEGELYLNITQPIDFDTRIQVNCTIDSYWPFLYGFTNYHRYNIAVIPPHFRLPEPVRGISTSFYYSSESLPQFPGSIQVEFDGKLNEWWLNPPVTPVPTPFEQQSNLRISKGELAFEQQADLRISKGELAFEQLGVSISNSKGELFVQQGVSISNSKGELFVQQGVSISNSKGELSIDDTQIYEETLFDLLQTTNTTEPTQQDPQGWVFPNHALLFRTTVEWPQGATLQDNLKPAVDRVLSVIRSVPSSDGRQYFSEATFDAIRFQSWSGPYGLRPTFDIAGTFNDTESFYDQALPEWTFTWTVDSEVIPWKEFYEVILESVNTAVVTALTDGSLQAKDALFIETTYGKTRIDWYVRNGPSLEACAGPQAFGRPMCHAKLPGLPCTHNLECASAYCTEQKTCGTTSYALQWNAYARPEALNAFSTTKFQYLTNGASSVVVTTFSVFIIVFITLFVF